MLSKKDIIAINAEFDSGKLVNESSLDYALKTIARSKNWLRAAALLTRAILIDHVFEDGNKRTAVAVIRTHYEMHGIRYDRQKVNEMIVQMLKKNTTSITQIERFIKDGIE